MEEEVNEVLFLENGVWKRVLDMPMITNNMAHEFKLILKVKTNEVFNGNNYEVISYDEIPKEDRKDYKCKCICSHNIYNLHTIRHIPTDQYFLVGCDCVTKIDIKLGSEMKIREREYKKEKKEDIKFQEELPYIRIDFGKFNGYLYRDILIRDDIFDYFKYMIKKTLWKPTSYTYYQNERLYDYLKYIIENN